MKPRLIRLNQLYRRAGSPVQIPPGDYHIDDKALNGWGPYLVDTGHASVVDSYDDVRRSHDDVPQNAPETVSGVEAPAGDVAFDPHAATEAALVEALEAAGVDVSMIEGTGKRGAIVRADLVAAYKQSHEALAAGPAEDAAPDEEA